jgi:hypothetical protein
VEYEILGRTGLRRAPHGRAVWWISCPGGLGEDVLVRHPAEHQVPQSLPGVATAEQAAVGLEVVVHAGTVGEPDDTVDVRDGHAPVQQHLALVLDVSACRGDDDIEARRHDLVPQLGHRSAGAREDLVPVGAGSDHRRACTRRDDPAIVDERPIDAAVGRRAACASHTRRSLCSPPAEPVVRHHRRPGR